MNKERFEQSIKDNQPPQDLSVYLQSLWYDAKGDWNKAHGVIDTVSGKKAAAVHAYLHRVEGDTSNANYWYNKAGKEMPIMSLQQEWKTLVEELINKE